MDDDFFLLIGILAFLMIFIYFACVPCGRRDSRRRENRQGNTGRPRRRPFAGLLGFRESVRRGNNYTFQSSEPPPTYQWVVEHADAPLVAYVNEVTGHIEYVKWDGYGPVPTRTVLGIRNEGLEVDTPAHSDSEQLEGREPEVREAEVRDPEVREPTVRESEMRETESRGPEVREPEVGERVVVTTPVT